MKRSIFLIFLSLLLVGPVFGHGAERADIALDEKLNQYLPEDAVFTDESGNKTSLGKLIQRPTIIAPVYLSCSHECPMLMNSLADVLGRMELVKPGKDYEVISLSFDENDTPQIAREKKRNYLKSIGKPFPGESWKFLTGDAANIKKFTDSIGFKFQRDGHDFSHPVTLVIVSGDRKIVRYIEGIGVLPFEMMMALTEAAEGRVSSPARKAMMYCFSYDPQKKSYVFNILKVTGTVMVLFVGSFLAYLLLSGKKKQG